MNDCTEDLVKITPGEVREHFTRSYGKKGTWFDYLAEELSKSIEIKSLTRKCFDRSKDELHSALTLRSETQYAFDKYTKKEYVFNDLFEAMFNDILGDLLFSEENYVTSVSKRARSKSFTCFDEMFNAVKAHQEHQCHFVGVEVWSSMVSCSNMVQYYEPVEKHELALSGVLGSLRLPGSPQPNCSAPLITDMFRLSRFAVLERDTWLHFETPCGIYYAEPLEVQIYYAGNNPGIRVKHGFACAITDQSKVRAYRLIDSTWV